MSVKSGQLNTVRQKQAPDAASLWGPCRPTVQHPPAETLQHPLKWRSVMSGGLASRKKKIKWCIDCIRYHTRQITEATVHLAAPEVKGVTAGLYSAQQTRIPNALQPHKQTHKWLSLQRGLPSCVRGLCSWGWISPGAHRLRSHHFAGVGQALPLPICRLNPCYAAK